MSFWDNGCDSFKSCFEANGTSMYFGVRFVVMNCLFVTGASDHRPSVYERSNVIRIIILPVVLIRYAVWRYVLIGKVDTCVLRIVCVINWRLIWGIKFVIRVIM